MKLKHKLYIGIFSACTVAILAIAGLALGHDRNGVLMVGTVMVGGGFALMIVANFFRK